MATGTAGTAGTAEVSSRHTEQGVDTQPSYASPDLQTSPSVRDDEQHNSSDDQPNALRRNSVRTARMLFPETAAAGNDRIQSSSSDPQTSGLLDQSRPLPARRLRRSGGTPCNRAARSRGRRGRLTRVSRASPGVAAQTSIGAAMC